MVLNVLMGSAPTRCVGESAVTNSGYFFRDPAVRETAGRTLHPVRPARRARDTDSCDVVFGYGAIRLSFSSRLRLSFAGSECPGSGDQVAVLELDDILPQITLSLNTQSAPRLIQEFRIECLPQRAGGGNHQIE